MFLFSLGPKLNTKIGLHITTTTHQEHLDQQYLSCYCFQAEHFRPKSCYCKAQPKPNPQLGAEIALLSV